MENISQLICEHMDLVLAFQAQTDGAKTILQGFLIQLHHSITFLASLNDFSVSVNIRNSKTAPPLSLFMSSLVLILMWVQAALVASIATKQGITNEFLYLALAVAFQSGHLGVNFLKG